MPELVELKINGSPVKVPRGTTVAAAVLGAGVKKYRRSSTGQAS